MELIQNNSVMEMQVWMRHKPELQAMYGRDLEELDTGWCRQMDSMLGREITVILNNRLKKPKEWWDQYSRPDQIQIGKWVTDSGEEYPVTVGMTCHTKIELIGMLNRQRSVELELPSVKEQEQGEYNLKTDLEQTITNISGADHDLGNIDIYKMLDRIRARKRDMVDYLGLDLHTMRRKFQARLTGDLAEQHIPANVKAWIAHLSVEFGFKFCALPTPHVIDHKGVEHKATRFLKRLVEAQDKTVPLDVLIGAEAKNKEGGYRQEIFWSKLGEIFNSPALTMYLSTNPCDLLTVSHEGGFSSCLRPNGEYFASVAHFLQDDFTAVCYVGTPRRKTGRALIYMPEGRLPSFLFSRSYGSFPEYMRAVGRQAIEETLAKRFGIPNEWIVDDAGLESRAVGGVYFDGAASELVVPRSGTISARTPAFERSRCIICDSRSVDNNRTVFCTIHGGVPRVSCCCCGATFPEDEGHWSGDNGPYCECCFEDRYSFCEDCNETYYSEDGYHVYDSHGHDRYVCDCCVDDYIRCHECHEYNHQDATHLATRNGNVICEECYESSYVTCEDCYEIVRDDTVFEVEGETVCEDCNIETHECVGCNDRFRNVDGDSGMCEGCHEENHSDCNGCGCEYENDDLDADGNCADCQDDSQEEAI